MVGRHFATAIVLLHLCASTALAGMPSIGLSEMARIRFATISFFGVGLLLSAIVVKAVWNHLAGEFTRLPRLTFRGGLSIVVLWGLLFVVVLTMISGARELLTPGAWVKSGVTYKLRSEALSTEPDGMLALRKERLAQVGKVLKEYAAANGGHFPPDYEVSRVVGPLWALPDRSGIVYQYVADRRLGDDDATLAYEPKLFDGDPMVLYVNGYVGRLPTATLEAANPVVTSAPPSK